MSYELNKGPELYDLGNDPKEKNNLAEKLPEVTRSMEQKLKNWEKKHVPRFYSPNGQNAIIPQETLDGLKAMGYIR